MEADYFIFPDDGGRCTYFPPSREEEYYAHLEEIRESHLQRYDMYSQMAPITNSNLYQRRMAKKTQKKEIVQEPFFQYDVTLNGYQLAQEQSQMW